MSAFRRSRLLLALGLFSRLAHSQSADSPTAEALFVAGRSALERGDSATACTRFEESYKLDPANGTLVNLATCEEDLNRLSQAWAHFRQLSETLPKDDDRRPLVKKHLDALDQRVPWLTLQLGEAPAGTTVTKDGTAVSPATLGIAFPVDPGRHHLVVAAPGRGSRAYDVDVKEAERRTVTLEPGAAATLPSPRRPVHAATPESHASRDAGYVSLGLAAGALVVTGLSGVFLLKERATVTDHCPTRATCDDTGLRATGMASVLQTTTVVAAAATVVAAGTGLFLVLRQGPASRSSTASFAIGPQGAAATMSF